jgi:hypothetical protein
VVAVSIIKSKGERLPPRLERRGFRRWLVMIKSVLGFKIGDNFCYGGVNFEVVSFPTRSMVCGVNRNPRSGDPSLCKVAISDLQNTKGENNGKKEKQR